MIALQQNHGVDNFPHVSCVADTDRAPQLVCSLLESFPPVETFRSVVLGKELTELIMVLTGRHAILQFLITYTSSITSRSIASPTT